MTEVLITRCVCRQVAFADLLPVAHARSWSLTDLVTNTGCGDQCGLCLPYLRAMLDSGQTSFSRLLPPDPAPAGPHLP